MYKKRSRHLLGDLTERLGSKALSTSLGLDRKEIRLLLERQNYAGRLASLLEGENRIRCQDVLEACRDTMDSICSPPEEGWLKGT